MHACKLEQLKMLGLVHASTEGKAIIMGILERKGKSPAEVLRVNALPSVS